MKSALRLLVALGGGALVLAGCASGDSVPAGGQPVHVIHYAATRSAAAGVINPNTYVSYGGGPVAVSPKMYLIFWGYKTYGDPDKVEPLLEDYAKAMGGSRHNNIYTQYYEILSSNKIYITNPSNQFGGAWNDESKVPKSPTDQQIAAEALKGVAHLGYDPAAVYVVATPHDHSSAGFGSHWCSYHSFTYYMSDELLPYANLPYIPDAGDECGGNIIAPPSDERGADEGVTIMAGHEYGEAVTDPEPFTGWNGVSGEIGDICAWHNIANDPFKKKSYTTQPMLSDHTASCVQAYK